MKKKWKLQYNIADWAMMTMMSMVEQIIHHSASPDSDKQLSAKFWKESYLLLPGFPCPCIGHLSENPFGTATLMLYLDKAQFKGLARTAVPSYVFQDKVTAHAPCMYTCNRSSNQQIVVTRASLVILLCLPNMKISITSRDCAIMGTHATF